MHGEVVLVLLGNQRDCVQEARTVSPEEGQEIAQRYGAMFFEISALNIYDVRNVMSASVEKAVEVQRLLNPPCPTKSSETLTSFSPFNMPYAAFRMVAKIAHYGP